MLSTQDSDERQMFPRENRSLEIGIVIERQAEESTLIN